MKNYKTYFFIFLIILQISIIIYLGKQIIERRNILGETSINPINSQNIIKPTIVINKNLKYFYEPKPNTKYEWWGTFYTINSDGLHELKNYSIKKPNNVFRIIALGDSFTFGLLVDDDENWPAVLEKIVNQNQICKLGKTIEVINLGVEGYDFQYAIERYHQRGEKYNPDLIIWMSVDFLRIRELMNEVQKEVVLPTVTHENKYASWRLMSAKYREKYSKEYIIEYQKKVIGEFLGQLSIPALLINLEPQFNNIFYSFEDKKKVFFLPINYTKKMQLSYDAHPSPLGHQIFAQEILNFLIAHELIPCY